MRTLVFAVVFSSAAACAQPDSLSRLNITHGDMVDGNASGPEKVSTVLLLGSGTCTGTIIAKDIILTASHCKPSSSTTVIFGLSRQNYDDAIKAQNVAIHPKGQLGAEDVALIKLSKEIPSGYKPVKLLTQNLALKEGEKVRLAGYGQTENTNGGVLKTVESTFQQDSDGSLFVQGNNSSENACYGDSGGPLFVQRNKEWYNAGIVSWGVDGCGQGAHYASVVHNYDQIVSMATKLSNGVNPFKSTTETSSKSKKDSDSDSEDSKSEKSSKDSKSKKDSKKSEKSEDEEF